MAAVLASGPCAVLSHRSAASLWRIRATTRSLIEVTASRQCSRPGIQTHRGSVPADEMTVLRGIPVTTVPRTLLDLAAMLPRRQVERAVNEAEVLQLFDALSWLRVIHAAGAWPRSGLSWRPGATAQV